MIAMKNDFLRWKYDVKSPERSESKIRDNKKGAIIEEELDAYEIGENHGKRGWYENHPFNAF